MKAILKETIRNEYVHGYINELGQRVMPTLEDLINKYETPASTVYRISSKDKWKDQRKAFRNKPREEIDLKKTEELQSKLYKSDEISAEIAHEIFNKIKELLRKEDQISPNGLASVSSS
jgi:signal recognition particle GTPase